MGTDGATDFINVTWGHFSMTVPDGKLDALTNGGVALEIRMRTAVAYPYVYLNTTSATSSRNFNLHTSLGNTYLRHYEQGWIYMLEAGNLNGYPNWTTIRLVCDDTSMLGYKDGGSGGGGNLDLELYNQVDPDGAGDGDKFGLWASHGATTEGSVRFDGYADVDIDYIRWTDGEPAPPKGTLISIL